MTNIVTGPSIVAGETVTVRARLQDQSTLNALVQADVDEIYVTVFDMDTGKRIWGDPIQVADHIFDTMQTSGWTGLGEYNFADDQPSDDWMNKAKGGRRYRVQYEFRLTSGRLIRRAATLSIEEWLDG